jgi:hypothetical protein
MRIPAILAFTGLAAVWLSLTSLDPSNPPTGRTGAPGETTCFQSSCHNGGNYTGTVTLTGLPDTVTAGHVYTLTLTNASNCVKTGFQLTCLDASNVKCGTLGTGTGVNIANSNNRQYARQSSAKNMSNGIGSWNFTWTAPATLTGDSLQFYFVTLCANGNGSRSGDNVLLSNKKVKFKTATSATSNPEADRLVRLFPNPARSSVRVQFAKSQSGTITVFDSNGRKALQSDLPSADNELNITMLPSGLYTAEIHFDKWTAVKQLIVEK